MTDAVADSVDIAQKQSRKPLMLAVLAVLVGGGGGFWAAYSGLIPAAGTPSVATGASFQAGALADVEFVPVEPMVISLSPAADNKHLRFRAQLEVPSRHASDVEKLMPRVIDVLNGYLRALEIRDLESAASMTRLRAQMLRRVQIVAGPDRVNDLLIMEFVLN